MHSRVRYVLGVVVLAGVLALGVRTLALAPVRPEVRLLGVVVPQNVRVGERYALFAGVAAREGTTLRLTVRVCGQEACRRVGHRVLRGSFPWWGALGTLRLEEPGVYRVELLVGVPWGPDGYRTVGRAVWEVRGE